VIIYRWIIPTGFGAPDKGKRSVFHLLNDSKEWKGIPVKENLKYTVLILAV
jgi:hypothetical protein